MAKRTEDLVSNDIACLWLKISLIKGKSFYSVPCIEIQQRELSGWIVLNNFLKLY